MAREEGRRETGPAVGLGPARAHHQPQGGQSQGPGGGPREGGCAAFYPSRSRLSSLHCTKYG